jgi:hypothetical protein
LSVAKEYVRSVGSALADTAVRIFEGLQPELRSDIFVERAFETLDLTGDSARAEGLCERPQAGTATIAGAADGPTRYSNWKVFGIFSLGLEAGSVDLGAEGCQKPKNSLFGPIQYKLVGSKGFPAYTQLGVVRVGDMLVGAVPGEVSTVAGLRMMAAMQQERPAEVPANNVTILGLTNGDLRYITTPEEYTAQLYEGGSNLYGPLTAEVFAVHLGRLTGSLTPSPTGPIVKVDSIFVLPGDGHPRWPKQGPGPNSLRFEAPPGCRGDTVVVRWYDAPPGSMVPADGLVISLSRLGDGTTVVDDDIDVEVRALGNKRHGHLWETRWTPPGGISAGERFSTTLLRWEGQPEETFECRGDGSR